MKKEINKFSTKTVNKNKITFYPISWSLIGLELNNKVISITEKYDNIILD